MLLLDAYLYNGHFDKALNLCQELSNSKHQTTQILAHYYLAEIFPEANSTEQKSSLNSTKSSLTPAQATELINTGYEAITKKRYKKAIQALNVFCKAASPATKHYFLAHKWLIKAYQENGSCLTFDFPKGAGADRFWYPATQQMGHWLNFSYPMPHVSFVCLLMYYFDFPSFPIPLDGIISY
ncbi:hypothetical protein LC608_26910 [Nostoc sp. XA010]|uniref:hypothetical protein n=1 Tax=Nostoc sp. XA010 TaxID=2780407 RepID=UPI001E2BA9C7|nr:hypothetical protein [Nostoc sp. XA010]MCC5660544.1 hypothetical protein [Nostoc sp. XA010]